MLLLVNLILTAMPMILGPAMVINVADSVVNNAAMSTMAQSASGRLAVVTNGYSVTSPVVISNTTWLVLLCSGDVETNPGPAAVEVAQGYEQSLVEGLAKLCRAAPSDTVRTVLGVWSPNKPGNEIRNTWQQGRRFLAPSLKGTLAWLTCSRECDVKGTKHDVAEQLLIALEALLPDTCQVCKELYSVDREDRPSLCCKGCRQGFHQTCFDRLEVGPSLAELPGEFSWLCSACAPLYELKTVVGGYKGQERPRLNRRGPVIPQPALPQQSTQQQQVQPQQLAGAESGGGEGVIQPDSQPAAADPIAEALSPPLPQPPPLPQSTPPGASAEISDQVCVLFLTGECPHGLSGKTEGICPDNHPKRCMPYMKWGNKSEKGCSGTTCGKCHPTLCPKSLDLKCLDRQCPWTLHTHRCMRADTVVRRGGGGDQNRGDWARVVGNGRGFKGGPRSGQHNQQGYSDAGQYRHGAGNSGQRRQVCGVGFS